MKWDYCFIYTLQIVCKRLSSPTTSVVDISLFYLSHLFLYIPTVTQHTQLSNFPEWWRKLLVSYINIECLICIMANSTTDLSSVEERQCKISRATQFWLEGSFTSARIQTKQEQRCMIRNARTGQEIANITDIKKNSRLMEKVKLNRRLCDIPERVWCVLPAHDQPLIHQYPQGLLGRAALNLFIP